MVTKIAVNVSGLGTGRIAKLGEMACAGFCWFSLGKHRSVLIFTLALGLSAFYASFYSLRDIFVGGLGQLCGFLKFFDTTVPSGSFSSQGKRL